MDTATHKTFLRKLTPTGKEVKRLVVEFMNKHNVELGEGFFASSAAWEAHGEPHARNAHLVIVYDGACFVRGMCSLDGENWPLNDKFRSWLNAYGYYFEEGTGWYGGIYSR